MSAQAITSTQGTFLELIKKILPTAVSFVDELSDVLKVSRDSAYRRIRGETILSLDEVKTLCNHYGVSIDSVLSINSPMVTFRHQAVSYQDFPFDHWLKYVLQNLTQISSAPEKELIYSAKDMLIFYLFKLPELSAFKMFFWMKTVVRHPELADEKYDSSLIPKESLALGENIWKKYGDLPSIEIWSDEVINATLRQILFYWECDLFRNADQAKQVCDQIRDLLDEIRQHASDGRRSAGGTFQLYKNEILIADNSVLFKMGDKRVAFINNKTLDFLSTSQESFCSQTESYLQNLINKSTQISGTGEKERTKFFNALNEKVNAVKEQIR